MQPHLGSVRWPNRPGKGGNKCNMGDLLPWLSLAQLRQPRTDTEVIVGPFSSVLQVYSRMSCVRGGVCQWYRDIARQDGWGISCAVVSLCTEIIMALFTMTGHLGSDSARPVLIDKDRIIMQAFSLGKFAVSIRWLVAGVIQISWDQNTTFNDI